MRVHASILFGVSFLLAGFGGLATGAAPSSALSGNWDVQQVMVDGKDQPRWLYKPNDPRLLNHALEIDVDRLAMNNGSPACRSPQWKPQATNWQSLLAEVFVRPAGARRSKKPTPTDFGLKVNPRARMTAYRVTCAAAAAGEKASSWNESWFVLDGSGNLIVTIDGAAVLALKRRPADAEPRPSFSCATAKGETQRAICRSVSLSGLDREMTNALQETKTRRPGDVIRLDNEHKRWLDLVERCGRDGVCIEQRMQERIEALVQEW